MNRATASTRSTGNTGGTDGRLGFEKGPSIEAAVVATVTVKAEAVVPFKVTELGETEQVDFASASPQVSVTVPLNPLIGATWRL